MPAIGFHMGDLMVKMMTGKTGEISRVQYAPEKGAYPADASFETHLPVSSPESQGVPSSFCETMLRRLSAHDSCSMHRLMIVRNGHVITSCSFHPFPEDIWHVTFSMCKSIAGMAIGLLIGEGKLSLDDRLSDFITVQRSGIGILLGPKKSNADDITIRQLLTMNTGVSFSESGALSGNLWTASYMDAPLSFLPGERFEYNSMNTYMLSAVLTKVTGETLYDYLKPRLFEPMGISRVLWENSPEGYTKAGWAMYLRMEDMVKFGMLYLQKGMWEGRQLVPQSFVEEATDKQIETGREHAPYYGYQLWLNDVRPGAFTFNGMLGQDVFCYPDLNLIVATNAGNDDVFQQSAMSHTIHEMVREAEGFSAVPLPENRTGEASLSTLVRSLEGENRVLPIRSGWKKKPGPRGIRAEGAGNLYERFVKDALNGAVYDAEVKSIGLMPLIMQMVHNNFTEGIRRFSFYLDASDVLHLELLEGAARYDLPLCFDMARRQTTLDFKGEFYEACAIARAYVTARDALALQIRVVFLEEAAERLIEIAFDGGTPVPSRIAQLPRRAPEYLVAVFDENPGARMMTETLRHKTKEDQGVVLSTLDSAGAIDVFNERVESTIRPTTRLHRMG